MTQTRNVPKQWYLTKTETIISFNNWKENQIYSLNMDKTFKPYLRDGATWGKKTAASPTRGYVDDGNCSISFNSPEIVCLQAYPIGKINVS